MLSSTGRTITSTLRRNTRPATLQRISLRGEQIFLTMNRLTRSQRDKVHNFRRITNSSYVYSQADSLISPVKINQRPPQQLLESQTCRVKKVKCLDLILILFSCSEFVAIECLSSSGWDLETGIDAYFTSWSSKPPPPATSKKMIEELFYQYSGSTFHAHALLSLSVIRFCKSQGILFP